MMRVWYEIRATAKPTALLSNGKSWRYFLWMRREVGPIFVSLELKRFLSTERKQLSSFFPPPLTSDSCILDTSTKKHRKSQDFIVYVLLKKEMFSIPTVACLQRYNRCLFPQIYSLVVILYTVHCTVYVYSHIYIPK